MFFESVDGDIVIKFNKLLVEEGRITLFFMVTRTLCMHLLTLLVRYMYQTGAKLLSILAPVEPPKVLIPIKVSV